MDISDWQQRGRDIIDVGRGSGRLVVPGGGTLKVIGLIVLALVLVSSLYYQINADEQPAAGRNLLLEQRSAMALTYKSGEEIQQGDRVTYGNNAGVIELVVEGLVGDPE